MLHIFTEEPSIKYVLEEIIYKLNLVENQFRIYPHQGKNDLITALKKTLPSISRIPDSKILITIDQDKNDCILLKNEIQQIIELQCVCDFKIRIICRELESWYLGDMNAIENAFPRFKSENYKNKSYYRNVDKIFSPNLEVLKIIPEYKQYKRLPKIEVAKRISPFLELEGNKSSSFNNTIKAIKFLLNHKDSNHS
jgi:hypothetical protein